VTEVYPRAIGAGRRVQSSGARAISSAGERFVHTEEVTGSIPVSPTVVAGAANHVFVQAVGKGRSFQDRPFVVPGIRWQPSAG
jgi:hypothetical protein